MTPTPCAAHPGTGFVHLDGPCHCFAGGPAPEFPQPDPPGWYDDHGWDTRDDAHRATFPKEHP